jgi:hypothetical protein
MDKGRFLIETHLRTDRPTVEPEGQLFPTHASMSACVVVTVANNDSVLSTTALA